MHTQRIVIIGAGFAGVHAAVGAVETLAAAQSHVSVELINPSPFWVMRPRLYESDLTGVRVPLEEVLEPLHVVHHQATVAAIDTTKRALTLDEGSALTYDQLILATGSRLALPDHASVHCADSYTQAVEMRKAVDQLRRNEGRFRAVVVGGSFTGIEVAAELAADANVTLVAGHELAPGYGPHARPFIEQALAALDVDVRAGVRVQGVIDGAAMLADGTSITADLVVWATGPRASALTEQIPARRDKRGRLLVDEFLQIGAGVWAAGDSACAKVDATHDAVMSCQQAGPQGRRAGENAAAVTLGLKPRRYRQPAYLTCLALGGYGGLLTCGFDRDAVLATGQEASTIKHAINHGLIYPPEGEGRDTMLKIGKNPLPAGTLAAALTQRALRSRWIRRKLTGSAPERACAYAVVDSDALPGRGRSH